MFLSMYIGSERRESDQLMLSSSRVIDGFGDVPWQFPSTSSGVVCSCCLRSSLVLQILAGDFDVWRRVAPHSWTAPRSRRCVPQSCQREECLLQPGSKFSVGSSYDVAGRSDIRNHTGPTA